MKLLGLTSMERTRYLIKFYYIGSDKYFGSQRQSDFETIETQITRSLFETNYIKDIKTAGFEVASRTDKFVSARGACFSFLSEKKPILMEINSALPRDIGLWASSEVTKDFSSRFNAIYRHYKYIFPLPENKREKYNLKLMKKASKVFEGRHNFLNFSKREKEDITTVRDMLLADCSKEGDYLVFNFTSQAFLRQQIRRMVAKILDVGNGILAFDELIKMFNSEEFISYQPADPKGLILWDIYYGDKINFTIDTKSHERMMRYFSTEFTKYSLKQKLFAILQRDNIG
ncbi:MAG: tRNA pseudouridine(38-40) synthase TruA [Promethearchaeota archaeon]|nr:MAG: tRNA pseudouridine(38-40) synthase TruA [Candidatus Lokiarchaeota archaeon]